ncbi:MAG: hypothetical protein EB060_10600 [Proteobacteria bacterium]|nr:hypothetical protein [Pseudomonadota bacterium]
MDVVHLSRADVAARELKGIIRDQVEELNPLNDTADMFSDLMSAALSEVDFREIAEHWINDIASEVAKEEEEEEEELA